MGTSCNLHHFLALLLSVEMCGFSHIRSKQFIPTEYIENKQVIICEQLCEECFQFEDAENTLNSATTIFDKGAGKSFKYMAYTQGPLIVSYRARDSPI